MKSEKVFSQLYFLFCFDAAYGEVVDFLFIFVLFFKHIFCQHDTGTPKIRMLENLNLNFVCRDISQALFPHVSMAFLVTTLTEEKCMSSLVGKDT